MSACAVTTHRRPLETILTPDKANAVYIAGYGFPMRDDDPEYPAVGIGGYIMGGGFLNSRLATRIRQEEGLSYGVRGGFGASSLDKEANFSAMMIYNPKNLPRLEAAFREEVERAAKRGFTAKSPGREGRLAESHHEYDQRRAPASRRRHTWRRKSCPNFSPPRTSGSAPSPSPSGPTAASTSSIGITRSFRTTRCRGTTPTATKSAAASGA